ncbi:MAG: hypothetical protein HN368_00820, partial [Spirochaetales bacterium]|nr:hypothetical protein [Spirochaetales bacterium]
PGAAPRTLTRDEVVSIEITSPGSYIIDGQEAGAAEVRGILQQKIGLFEEPIVVLNVASGIKYQEVLSVLEEARYAGYSGFSVKTDEENPLGLRIDAE